MAARPRPEYLGADHVTEDHAAVKLTPLLRVLAVLVGAAMIIFVIYATPIIWRQPELRWVVLIAWPLAVGGIRLLRLGAISDPSSNAAPDQGARPDR